MQPTASGPVRESGMPTSEYWSTFFEPEGLLDEFGFIEHARIIEFGAGYGDFTVPLARRCQSLTTFEISPELCTALSERLRREQVLNVSIVEGNFFDRNLLCSQGTFDAVVLFNIVHMENPPVLIRELRTVMRPEGLVYLLHWRTDLETPRGPSLAIRSSPEQCRNWFAECGFGCTRELLPKSAAFHFAQVYSIVDKGL